MCKCIPQYVVSLSGFKLLLVHNLITHSSMFNCTHTLIIAFTLYYVQDGRDLRVPPLMIDLTRLAVNV